MKKVVIIGGGIAGLSLAYNLLLHARLRHIGDLAVTLLEKSERPGGNIRTERINGFLIEGGPDCFLSEKPWAMELCKSLGLSDRLLPTKEARGKTYVFSSGRLHLLPEGVILMVPTKILPLLTSTLITFRGKLRMALELFIPKRKEKGDETLSDFVRRRLGAEALEKIAEPLVAGVHAGDADTMSVKASFPRFVELEENYGSLIRGMLARMRTAQGGKTASGITMFMTLKGGLGELVDRIVEELEGVSIGTKKNVRGIVKKNTGYEVLIEGEPSLHAHSVVVATPAYVAAGIVKGMDSALSAKLLNIPYASTATVSMGYKRKDLKEPLNGFGFVVPGAENRKIMAATWSSEKWEGRAPGDSVLIRCFVGGAKKGELVFLSDKEMAETVKGELKEIMGIEAEPVLVKIFRWEKAMPQYVVGHGERIKEIEELMSKHPGLYLTGSAYHGIGISDTVREAEVAAKKVLRYLEVGIPA